MNRHKKVGSREAATEVEKQPPKVFCKERYSKKLCKIHRKTPGPKAYNFINKETLAEVFSCEFCEISKNTFFIGHFQETASGSNTLGYIIFGPFPFLLLD